MAKHKRGWVPESVWPLWEWVHVCVSVSSAESCLKVLSFCSPAGSSCPQSLAARWKENGGKIVLFVCPAHLPLSICLVSSSSWPVLSRLLVGRPAFSVRSLCSMSLQRCGFLRWALKKPTCFFGERWRGLLIASAYVCHFITSRKIELQQQQKMKKNASNRLTFVPCCAFFLSPPLVFWPR